MPELPEVETVRLQLLHKIVGKTIKCVYIHHFKSVALDNNFASKLKGQTINQIDRIGKLLIFSFVKNTNLFLLAHLKMTGQFFYVDKTGMIIGGGHSQTAKDSKKLPNSHTRVSYVFTDNTTLHFNDMRIFGYNKLATTNELALIKTKFGPEPIHKDFDIVEFTNKLKKHKTPIKATLLDQSFIAGLGNIYVDETLFVAGVRPTRLTNKVTRKEALAIVTASGQIMNTAITVGGTTFQHFADTNGDNGNYTDYLQIFGKQNTPCPRCGTIIKKIRCAGRGTHYCPSCQK